MKIYLNEKISSIPIIRDLLILLKQFYSSKLAKRYAVQTTDITIRHLYDPVRDFIEYYNSALDTPMDEETVTYIINALYMSKGSQKVLEMMKELLEINLRYVYDYPYLDVLEFTSGLQLTNINLFKSKLQVALYYLLFYSKFNLSIPEFTQVLRFELDEYASSNAVCYRIIIPKIDKSNYLITYE